MVARSQGVAICPQGGWGRGDKTIRGICFFFGGGVVVIKGGLPSEGSPQPHLAGVESSNKGEHIISTHKI